MADNGLKMPEEYTEFSYEDGELSGSGTERWTKDDTLTVLKWAGVVTGIVGVGLVGHRIWSGHWIWQSCSRADPQLKLIPNDISNRHEGGNDPPVPDQINVENEEGDRGSRDNAVQQAYLFIINDFYNEGRMEVARQVAKNYISHGGDVKMLDRVQPQLYPNSEKSLYSEDSEPSEYQGSMMFDGDDDDDDDDDFVKEKSLSEVFRTNMDIQIQRGAKPEDVREICPPIYDDMVKNGLFQERVNLTRMNK